MQKSQKIAIVGSGLVGSLLAIYLKKEGHTVHVYDRSPDIRTIQFSGRSINLAMSNRGWNALDGAGVGDKVRHIAIAMEKRAIHIGNQLNFQHYGLQGECIYSISRGVLNRKMIDLAEEAGAEFFFEQKIWDVNLTDATLQMGETERGEWTNVSYDMVFGADGAFSRIRHRMQRQSMFNYSQDFLNTGYKELHIPANPDGSYKLDKHSLHIWPRGKYMLIALPNLDGSFTCTLFMPFEGENSFASLDNRQKVEAFFAENLPDTVDVIPDLAEDFFKNPTSTLVTMKCFPWTYSDKVALIGDAAHAIVPFYGQGMNAGFEDITILYQMMQEYGNDWKTIFSEYEKSRKPDADAIAELSYRNFMEMSTKTANEKFLLQKKIERWFASKYPEKWIPLYDRVTFSTRPYSEALAIGDFQETIMQEILKIENIETNWETEEIEHKIIQLLNSK
ncbi:FAD-dependent monooxygenase [Flavobacterium psychrophilum]|uniref:Kynurenine 3-monooxygenase n=3 Tax=Flavobacterium psychrophilum TaxID=96345 RepID=KMO_FLAPJ|nr:NAD(P)/FAD-dependent oxidoreductase [Flavobacterium psychrophilum]A6H1P4.1 RecName: Full=Kynurenine 3-monooxygenase; AltName: Full=Kynurenine 3-hydroxylase [Flavobacterium psychrophilum JIP02/86]AIG30939.1 kynurenine 3-monooxygenase [Flavobacterium psychrophilum]AIG33216.1 kynurenine 3-monooxygenase [Flavobacterium psychrophilum]AIG35365.1 kynurenine 3-monooxygenase [Flavobacterium psychrophilum]AIG37725.1 kynurenine 3-monooxygenase [Flavobacterium psychrophilum]AIG39997.1 kynurenine 3-mon